MKRKTPRKFIFRVDDEFMRMLQTVELYTRMTKADIVRYAALKFCKPLIEESERKTKAA